jgi:hypothetical protein
MRNFGLLARNLKDCIGPEDHRERRVAPDCLGRFPRSALTPRTRGSLCGKLIPHDCLEGCHEGAVA